MAGDFDERIAELLEQVGRGDLTGTVEVNQVYAQYQHEGLDLNHPRGGQAKYLEQPLMDNVNDYLQGIANDLLTTGPVDPMIHAMEDLSGQVEKAAPVDLGNLRESGHPTVTDGESTVYDRPPVQRRLTEDELRALHHHH